MNGVARVSTHLCDQFNVAPAELLGGSRRRPVSEVRQLLCYTGCSHLGLTMPELGRVLNVSKQAVSTALTKAEEVWEDLSWLSELTVR